MPQPEEEEIIDPDLEEDETDESGGQPAAQQPTIEQKLAMTTEQKKKYRKLAIDPETGKPYKKLLEEARAGNTDETRQQLQAVDQKVNDMQLKSEHSLDDQDLMVLKGISSGAGKTPAEILSDKESQGFKAFETYRRGKTAKSVEDTVVPEPTTRVPVVGDKSFGELEQSEKPKHYSGTVDTLIKKARSSNRNLT